MNFLFQPVSEEEVLDFLAWRYEPPYDVYNIERYDEDLLAYFLNPNNNYYSLILDLDEDDEDDEYDEYDEYDDQENELVAFCSFGLDAQVPGGDYSFDALDIGLGVRPDLTGQGRGYIYVKAVLGFAQYVFAPPAYRVTIAGWNGRARRVWEKAGFRWVETFHRLGDQVPFDVLIKEETT